MKHLKKYNESNDASALNDIFNIARDEGLVVKNDKHDTDLFFIYRYREVGYKRVFVMESDKFIEIVMDIHNRINNEDILHPYPSYFYTDKAGRRRTCAFDISTDSQVDKEVYKHSVYHAGIYTRI